MLTVLHRGPDGSERTFEAEFVARYAKEGEQSVPPLGEIRATGVQSSTIPGDSITLDIGEPFGAVFVMNRHGATVARYMHPLTPSVGGYPSSV
jgi:hypothetical protein